MDQWQVVFFFLKGRVALLTGSAQVLFCGDTAYANASSKEGVERGALHVSLSQITEISTSRKRLAWYCASVVGYKYNMTDVCAVAGGAVGAKRNRRQFGPDQLQQIERTARRRRSREEYDGLVRVMMGSQQKNSCPKYNRCQYEITLSTYLIFLDEVG
jgi:hypothetical protein